MGVVQYYRESIAQLASFGAVLTRLTSKSVEWLWTAREQAAFDEIKRRLATATARAMPDFSKTFVVATDASVYGLGGVIMQANDKGILCPLAFYSRQTTKTEAAWSQYELELKALSLCYKHWRHYLDGVRSICYTDSHTLVTGRIFEHSSTHQHNPKVLRMIQGLLHFDVDLRHHRPTAPLAKAVDALSRRPDFMQLRDLAKLPQQLTQQVSAIQFFLSAVEEGSLQSRLDELRNFFATSDQQALEREYEKEDGLWYRFGRLY